jgi:hydroxyacylglutathione hydrolase
VVLRQISDPQLAQYAYLVGCRRTGEALVIDPERDIDRYMECAHSEDLRVVAVVETHIHADFLSGCREFVERYGCRAYLSGEGGTGWKYEWADSCSAVTLLRDGDRFSVGKVDFRTLHTPGHTPEHLVFEVTDRGAGADEPMGIFSGDFIFAGDLGRPDLLESAVGKADTMEPAAHDLYASAQSVFRLPEYLRIWPAHGAGSMCGKTLAAGPGSTIGYEIRFNPALGAARKEEKVFVDFILKGQPDPPAYFARMKEENRRGPVLLGELPSPPGLGEEELRIKASDGSTVLVDTRRDRDDYYAGHIPGSIYAPVNKAFPIVTGSYIQPDREIVLLCHETELEDAVRCLIRIGLDRVTGWAPPEAVAAYQKTGGRLARIDAISFRDVPLRQTEKSALILDVRTTEEFAQSRLNGAAHIAHTRLAAHTGELPRDREILVHCRTGARASAAVSYLKREGYRPVAVNDLFSNAPLSIIC